jgi:hypothetical protein
MQLLTFPERREILTHPARFKQLISGRRYSKSVTGWMWTIKDGIEEDENYGIFCPYLKQAKKNIWPLMQDLARQLGLRPNKSELSLTFDNNGNIQLFGTDNPDSIPGSGLKKAWCDEFSLWKDQSVFDRIIRPMLTQSEGPALFTTSPRGYDKSYDQYVKGQDPTESDWMSWLFKTKDSPFVNPAEVEAAKRDMDPVLYAQEYEASFETGGNRAAYMFDRNIHVKEHSDLSSNQFIGLDFNVEPMVAEIGCIYPDGSVHFFDEVVIHNNAYTSLMVEKLREKYPHINDIYPDPTGKARSVNAPRSNHAILQEAGYNVQARLKPPDQVDRLAAFNRMLCDGSGKIRLTMSAKCKMLIRDCEKAKRLSDGRIDKGFHDPHAMDAGTYIIEKLFPVSSRNVLSAARVA